jgi:hypothetical protein
MAREGDSAVRLPPGDSYPSGKGGVMETVLL